MGVDTAQHDREATESLGGQLPPQRILAERQPDTHPSVGEKRNRRRQNLFQSGALVRPVKRPPGGAHQLHHVIALAQPFGDKQRLSDQVTGLRLEVLGFDAATLRSLRRLSAEPYGMMLVTGPTSSGKTTTLYAAISEINHGHDKIITIEDPVEYELPGVLQIPVNEKKGLTFARGLRSILRHDPDKIMVGEIRDGETAQIAVQAALTGHLVLTTVHANNVFDVLGRFTHMGLDPHSLVAALNGIAAQRLVRINCPDCAQDEPPEAGVLARSGIGAAQDFRFRAGRGCASCRGTGFKGRKAVAEVLTLDDALRELMVSREPVRRIKEAARDKGTRLMREVGLDLVRSGETSLQELNRVVS